GRRLLYDGACVGEDCREDDEDVAAVRVPPSLRAVVIAVVAANRLAAFAQASSAARRTCHDDSVGGPAAGATVGGAGSGRGRQHRYHSSSSRSDRGSAEQAARRTPDTWRGRVASDPCRCYRPGAAAKGGGCCDCRRLATSRSCPMGRLWRPCSRVCLCLALVPRGTMEEKKAK
ncbi:unnamed protein product, partial [Ectocarpus sp. 12 AP-2014]